MSISVGSKPNTSARWLLSAVLDAGSFISWDSPVDYALHPESYRSDLQEAATKSGADESVITGEGRIRGRRVAVAISEFDFLAGSIGLSAANRLVCMFERATAEGLPVLASPASGGTRMQEGTPAFVAMVKITDAVSRYKQNGLPYLVYLRSPTTGGVMASWGSLGHVTAAEPGALLGFLGPRVHEALTGERFPPNIQTSENMHDRGLVDAVFPPDHLRDVVSRTLALVDKRYSQTVHGTSPLLRTTAVPKPSDRTEGSTPVWGSILRTRTPDRPGVRELLRYGASDMLSLSGTGEGERTSGVLAALVRFHGINCVLVGQDRRSDAPIGPMALRQAIRGMQLAEDLRLPLISVIDTDGADLSPHAENRGIAGAIARSIAHMMGLQTPTVSLLLGQGTGGAALAMLPADRTIATTHAWLAPLPPEGASAIRHRTTDRAAEMAEQQQISAHSLRRAGIIDVIVDEPENMAGATNDFMSQLSWVLAATMEELIEVPPSTLAAERRRKYSRIA